MAALTPFSQAKMCFISKRIWCKEALKNIYNLLANYSMQQILIYKLVIAIAKCQRAKILPIRACCSICLERSRITVIYENSLNSVRLHKGKLP